MPSSTTFAPKTLPVTKEMQDLVRDRYNRGYLSVGILGTQSAIPTAVAAKRAGLRTVLLVEKGRELYYTAENGHLFDEVILLDKWKDVTKPEVIAKLVLFNTFLMLNRGMTAYWGYDIVETLPVPIYGPRVFARVEDRHAPGNQYFLMDEAGIRRPRTFSDPSQIDRPVITKTQNVKNPKDRANWFSDSPESWEKGKQDQISRGIITEESLGADMHIEEDTGRHYFHANFQVYRLGGISPTGYDFVGNSDREQTDFTMEEIGHRGKTTRESLIYPLYYVPLQKLLAAAAKYYPPGLFGPLGLQGAIRPNPDDPKRAPEWLMTDASLARAPGDPCMGPTSPEMPNLRLKHRKLLELHNMTIEDPLDLEMLELKEAVRRERLPELAT